MTRKTSPFPSSAGDRTGRITTQVVQIMTVEAGRPLVSLIIPNYNYERALHLTIPAALAQTYQPVEVLVVDDCSTDGSAATAEALGATVLRTPENLGAPGARNYGTRGASGEILFFADSDAALAPDAVARAVALLTSDPRIGVVCGVYEPVPLIRDSLVEEYRCLQLACWNSGEGEISTTYTAMLAIRAAVFDEVGGFDPRLRDTENAEFGARVTARGYKVLLTRGVRSTHDHDDKLRTVLSKFFTRTRKHIPLYMRKPDFSGGLANGPRAYASLVALALIPSVALPVLLGPGWAAVPAGIAVALSCQPHDRGRGDQRSASVAGVAGVPPPV
jgi:glycosyltransferase involved in cell wall biosynthesis